MQGSFRAPLGVASVFCSCRLTTRMGSLEMFFPPTSGFFFGVNLDYLDFFDGPTASDNCNVRLIT